MNDEQNQAAAYPLEDESLLLLILDFCDWHSLHSCIFLSRQQRQILTSEASFRWRIEKLRREKGICFQDFLPTKDSWLSQFQNNWKIRHLWQNAKKERTERGKKKDGNSFRIQVCARLRPRQEISTNSLEGEVGKQSGIILPLHQRVALIQADRKVSRLEALKDLYDEGGLFGETKLNTATEEEEDDDDDGIHRDDAAARRGGGLSGGVQWIDTDHSRVFVADRTKGIREFQFDTVEDGSSQQRIYYTCAAPLVSNLLNGFNTTCLVYGMTGSGKTHTMFGPGVESIIKDNTNEKQGVIPRVCFEIFDAMETRRANPNLSIESSLHVSYVEIYGDDVTDLLRGGVRCGQSRVAAQRYVLDGSAEVRVTSLEDTLEQLRIGEMQKRKAATAMNQQSSRAHAIFLLTLEQTSLRTNATVKSRMLLADLGGCEQLKKSKPGKENDKERTREAININLGLLALKKCVERLTSRGDNNDESYYIPFADSKLTMLLSSGLSGNSKTSVIICGAQEEEHAAETISTMRFGEACGGLTTSSATNNINTALQDVLNQIDDRIAECEEVIQKKERWETRTVERNPKDGTLTTLTANTFNKTVLVGAGQERRELERLLKKREELTRVN